MSRPTCNRSLNKCSLPEPITSVIQEKNGVKRKIKAASIRAPMYNKKIKKSLETYLFNPSEDDKSKKLHSKFVPTSATSTIKPTIQKWKPPTQKQNYDISLPSNVEKIEGDCSQNNLKCVEQQTTTYVNEPLADGTAHMYDKENSLDETFCDLTKIIKEGSETENLHKLQLNADIPTEEQDSDDLSTIHADSPLYSQEPSKTTENTFVEKSPDKLMINVFSQDIDMFADDEEVEAIQSLVLTEDILALQTYQKSIESIGQVKDLKKPAIKKLVLDGNQFNDLKMNASTSQSLGSVASYINPGLSSFNQELNDDSITISKKIEANCSQNMELTGSKDENIKFDEVTELFMVSNELSQESTLREGRIGQLLPTENSRLKNELSNETNIHGLIMNETIFPKYSTTQKSNKKPTECVLENNLGGQEECLVRDDGSKTIEYCDSECAMLTQTKDEGTHLNVKKQDIEETDVPHSYTKSNIVPSTTANNEHNEINDPSNLTPDKKEAKTLPIYFIVPATKTFHENLNDKYVTMQCDRQGQVPTTNQVNANNNQYCTIAVVSQKRDEPDSLNLQNENLLQPPKAMKNVCQFEMDQDMDILSASQQMEIENEFREILKQSSNVMDEAPIKSTVIPMVTGNINKLTIASTSKNNEPNFQVANAQPIPTFDWMKKMEENKQTLKEVVQELAKLNAIMMKVRQDMCSQKRQATIPSSAQVQSNIFSSETRTSGAWDRGSGIY